MSLLKAVVALVAEQVSAILHRPCIPFATSVTGASCALHITYT